jgi:hypothetical protein
VKLSEVLVLKKRGDKVSNTLVPYSQEGQEKFSSMAEILGYLIVTSVTDEQIALILESDTWSLEKEPKIINI